MGTDNFFVEIVYRELEVKFPAELRKCIKKCDFLFIFLVICIKVLYMYMAKSTVAGDEDCTKCIEPRRMEEREYDIKSDTAEYD